MLRAQEERTRAQTAAATPATQVAADVDMAAETNTPMITGAAAIVAAPVLSRSLKGQ
jgi:hypothetical protein